MINKTFLMMCYKYWLEGKTKFIISVLLLTFIIIYMVNNAGETIQQHPATHFGRKIVFTQYVWVILYKGYFLTLFTFSAFIFGLGGPMQERQNGTVLFTLSLPLYRKVILRAKIITGGLQVVALSLLTAFMLPGISTLFGYHYPLKDALLFSCLMSTAGLLFMLLGIYLSIFINKQMLIPALGVAILSAVFFITKIPALQPLNIFEFIIGSGYLSNANFLFSKDINLAGIGVILSIATGAALFVERVFRRMDL